MKRYILMFVAFFVLLMLATGCWNRKELNDMAILTGVGIDKSRDGYFLSVQVVVPGVIAAKKGGGTETPVTMYQAKADTLFEAVRKITTVSPRKTYWTHLQVVVLGEDFAKAGISKALEFLDRDHEVRNDFFIVVAKRTKAESVLKTLTSLEKIPANKIFASLENSEKAWAPTKTVRLDELITTMTSKGKDPVLTAIKVVGDEEKGRSTKNIEEIASPAQLQSAGLAVLKKDKLIGWLNEQESKGFNYIINNVKSTVGDIPCPKGGKAVIEVVRAKSDIKAGVKRGRPQVDVEIRIKGNVGALECPGFDPLNPNEIADLEKTAEERLKEIVERTIVKAQKKLKTDIFGFGEAIRRSNPQYWKTVMNDWDEQFSRLKVNVKTQVKLRVAGKVGDPFLNKIKE